MKKLTIKDLEKIMLDNFVNEYGDLYISRLDFSDFDGDVYINIMKVKKNLYQNWQKVGGDLIQDNQKVGGYLRQNKLKSHKTKIKNENIKALTIFDFME